jgi:hypothetical protein
MLSSRIYPALGRRKAPTAPGNPRKAPHERPALAGNPRSCRCRPERRTELCKPEARGSNPLRSINTCKPALLRCPHRRDRGPTAHLPCVLTPAKPACRRKSLQSLTAGRPQKALTTGNDSHRPVCRDFPGAANKPSASSRAHPAPQSILASNTDESRLKSAEDGDRLVAPRELLAFGSEAATTGVTRLAPATSWVR